MFDLKIVSDIANAYRLVKEVIKDSQERHRQPADIEINEHKSDSDDLSQRYQVAQGKRHEFLRTKVLCLTEKEMSDFYGYEKASLLINYELGKDEFPTASINKLVDTFFIEPEYIEEGKYQIFKTFNITSSSSDCKKFLSDSFEPIFLCDPNFDKTGDLYLVFYKKEKVGERREIHRAIRSNDAGSFNSNGGRRSIERFIEAMLETHYNSYISLVDVNAQEWKRLSECSWYCGKNPFSKPSNYKARDMFDRLVALCKKS